MTSLCNLEDLRIIIYYYFITINLIINDQNILIMTITGCLHSVNSLIRLHNLNDCNRF